MDRFEDAKLRIKEATDLVALIESYVPLRPRGRLLVALCPFHAEGSPSFTVYREEQYFRCYGCGKYGDVFTWLMEREGLSFREAMEQLADTAGISLEGVFKSGALREARGPDPFEALAEVAGFFQKALLAKDTGRAARDYVEQRGLGDAIEPWRLGYHPAPGMLTRYARDRKLPFEVLEHAGLVQGGREKFAHRLMFPIEDARGRVVAFGGRIVPGTPSAEADGDFKPPKYLNSPESPFFHKGKVLYGLYRSKQAHQKRLVVMEGYTDVIASHLAGFPGAVASLGTAFTAEHARTVERYASDGLVLMFDGDRAGVQAAERAVRELANARLSVRIAMMSDADGTAKDPGDVLVARPGEDPELVADRRARFADVIDGAEDWLVVWFRLLRRRLDFAQPARLEEAAGECARLLQRVEEPLRKAAMQEQMAKHLAVPQQALERMLQKLPQARRSNAAEASAAVPVAPVPGVPGARPLAPRERSVLDLVACILARPALLDRLDLDGCGEIDPIPAELLGFAADGAVLGRTTPAELVRYLFARAGERAELRAFLAHAHERAGRIREPQVELAGILAGLRRQHGEGARRQIRLELMQALAAGDTARAAELQRQLLLRMREDAPHKDAPDSSSTSRPSSTQAGAGPPSEPPDPPPDPPPVEGSMDHDGTPP